jgi:hypothetical protein
MQSATNIDSKFERHVQAIEVAGRARLDAGNVVYGVLREKMSFTILSIRGAPESRFSRMMRG